MQFIIKSLQLGNFCISPEDCASVILKITRLILCIGCAGMTSDIAKTDFARLAVDGSNYLTWAIDAENRLEGMKLDHCITPFEAGKDGRKKPDKANALYVIRHHLDPDLKSEYMTEKDPLVLWQSLKDRFSQQQSIMLPRAQQDWINLRFQDFKSVTAYNSALHKLVSKLKLCGQKITDTDMIEKTLSTFHPGNIVLQQQYRNSKYNKYSELIQVLMFAEQQNEVLMNNHSARPTGTIAVPEAHANVAESSRNQKRGRGKKPWKGKKGAMFNGKGKRKPKGRGMPKKERGENDGEEQGECFRCGTKGHWSRNCRTPKHLIDLYQQAKKKDKGQPESHFTTEPEAQKRNDMDVDAKGNGGDVQLDDDDDLLDDDMYGDLQ